MRFVTAEHWKEQARCRVLRPMNGGVRPVLRLGSVRFTGTILLMVCVVAGCGASSERNSTRTTAARTSTASSASVRRSSGEPVSAVSRGHRIPRAQAAAITATLTTVFVHPEASQCTRSMTAQFVSQFFLADSRRSGTSVLRACRDHQRERAQLSRRYRVVTVHDLEVNGHRAHAIVRGANAIRSACR